jgi:hypothetical protein
MNRRQVRWVATFGLGVLLAGCKDFGIEPQTPATGSPAPSPSTGISFSADVLPILTNAGCVDCHGGNGGLSVGTVALLLAGGDHGPAVVPGKADSSNLIRKLLTPPPFGSRMPFGRSPLPETSITTIKSWINQGALNN